LKVYKGSVNAEKFFVKRKNFCHLKDVRLALSATNRQYICRLQQRPAILILEKQHPKATKYRGTRHCEERSAEALQRRLRDTRRHQQFSFWKNNVLKQQNTDEICMK
jgi:hypothetical protein